MSPCFYTYRFGSTFDWVKSSDFTRKPSIDEKEFTLGTENRAKVIARTGKRPLMMVPENPLL